MSFKSTCEVTHVDEPLTLNDLFAAIEQQISERLTGLETVATWPEIGERTVVRLPALFLELAEIEPGEDDGTGQTALVGKFEARVVVGSEQHQPSHQAAQFVAQLAVLLRAQYWGLHGVGPAEFVQAVPDWTKPELDGYTVWLAEWTQALQLGEEEWPWPDQSAAFLVFDEADARINAAADAP